MENVRLIAIVGGSGSGKTWLARRLKRRLGVRAGILSLDNFYCDLSPIPKAERDRFNFDDPGAIDWELFTGCITQIRSGLPSRIPVYDFSTHTRLTRKRAWKPRSIVLIEGLWLLHRPELRRSWTNSIFVGCPEELRLQRRIERDQLERGRSTASVRRQFQEYVAPMHNCHVAPQAQFAGMVINSPIPDDMVRQIIDTIIKPQDLGP